MEQYNYIRSKNRQDKISAGSFAFMIKICAYFVLHYHKIVLYCKMRLLSVIITKGDETMSRDHNSIRIAVCDDMEADRKKILSLLNQYLDSHGHLATIDQYVSGEEF